MLSSTCHGSWGGVFSLFLAWRLYREISVFFAQLFCEPKSLWKLYIVLAKKFIQVFHKMLKAQASFLANRVLVCVCVCVCVCVWRKSSRFCWFRDSAAASRTSRDKVCFLLSLHSTIFNCSVSPLGWLHRARWLVEFTPLHPHKTITKGEKAQYSLESPTEEQKHLRKLILLVTGQNWVTSPSYPKCFLPYQHSTLEWYICYSLGL